MSLYILSQASFVFKKNSNYYERDCLFTGLQKDLRGHPFQHSSWNGKRAWGFPNAVICVKLMVETSQNPGERFVLTEPMREA